MREEEREGEGGRERERQRETEREREGEREERGRGGKEREREKISPFILAFRLTFSLPPSPSACNGGVNLSSVQHLPRL